MKVLLVSVDGLRPDAITNHAKAQSFIKRSAYTMHETTVMPSVTLPCHMTMFHSVDPGRHGTVTNVHMTQVRPVDGICDVLTKAKKLCGFFYNWYELRDLARPGSMETAYYCKGRHPDWGKANDEVTDAAIKALSEKELDFAFLYLGYVDEAGHKFGWMSPEYMAAVDNSFDNIERIVNTLSDDWAVIITADHGGHDRCHGSDMPEDMTIPLIIFGKGIEARELEEANIKDIAPTVIGLIGVEPCEDWEGKNLL
ncbi:MAG: alkaline phosphatase family protein [Clostridia bacterium]|nr:alkaline phosphatase family protein [Clostridia bacterium]